MKPIVVWGASGQALVVSEFAARIGYAIRCFVDNDRSVRSPVNDIPVVHGLAELAAWLDDHDGVDGTGAVVAIGGENGRDRIHIGRELAALGLEIVRAIHPTAYVAQDVRAGEGLQAMAGAIVGAQSVVGRQCIINTGASIDHECTLHDGVHVGPGSCVAGCVTIGEYSFLGTGSVVLPRIHIGMNVIVGAGAVVTKDIADGMIVSGNPARPHR